MRLKRLELQGFKSFLDRTILTFEPGITGVVGPNGCGKSNIVDAIMWVMGEQSAKHLRGDSMTDVIFNGSDSKAPTSLAEVSLILEREGEPLAPQFSSFDKSDEISVTRRISRDGTGEFLINKTSCRLKDIHELFMDTGVGRRAYSIIEQGQIDRMINVKPEDRRIIFEEVAGITKYKSKRKEAEKKLELTSANIVRAQDIITELEKQIRSLKIQATRARKYREIKGELEAVDLFLLGRELHSRQKSLETLEKQKDDKTLSQAELETLFSRVEAELTELELRRIDQEKKHESLSQQERDLALTLQKLENDLSLFEERKRSLQASAQSLKEQLARNDQETASLLKEQQNTEQETSACLASLQSLSTELISGGKELEEWQHKKTSSLQEKEELVTDTNRINQEQIHLQEQKDHAEAKRIERGAAQKELEHQLEASASLLGSTRELLEQVETKIENCSAKSLRAEKEVAEIHGECMDISSRLSELEETLFKSREGFHLKNSRLQSLEELQKNLEGYSPTAREILLKLDELSIEATPLAEVIQPDANVEEVVELLLGNDMNTLLVQSSHEAKRLAEMIDERGLERVKILALSELGVSPEPFLIGITPLASKVRVMEGYERAADFWLHGVHLCQDLDELWALQQQFPNKTFLCADHKVIALADGSFVSGTLPTASGVFARRREIEELQKDCRELQSYLNTLELERQNLLQHLEAQERLHSQLKDKLSSLHIEAVEHRKEKEKLQLDCSRTENQHATFLKTSEQNVLQISQLEHLIGEQARALNELSERQTQIASTLSETDETLKSIESELQTLILSIQERKIEESRLKERFHGLDDKTKNLKHQVQQLNEHREFLKAQQFKEESELEQIEETKQRTLAQKQTKETERNALLIRLTEAKTIFQETCEALNQHREKRESLQKQKESLLQEIQELLLKIAEERSALERLREISIERHHKEAAPIIEGTTLELEKAPLFQQGLNIPWDAVSDREKLQLLDEHLKHLREKVERYGEVNLTAIQEFDEVQKRYDFLIAQREDLEKSIQILEQAIKKIDETTRKRFEETFEMVNKKFQEIFPILFSGGKAEIVLSEPTNLLESGVDVMVQPPGKRLQSITLLSGGEKALTAVSLILAIFSCKPSPFCLLDEVDAPLDDANVSRFNAVVKKMAEKTQFIIITHNKKTMEIAEALYGVTMERAGISKMTSVRLS